MNPSGIGVIGTLLAEGTPSDGSDMTSATVTPGVGGFIFVFLVGAAIILLIVDMNRRVRRVQADAKVTARMEAEAAAAEGAAAADAESPVGSEGSVSADGAIGSADGGSADGGSVDGGSSADADGDAGAVGDEDARG
ncbi:hypothetical protein ACXET9_15805 [Brachybacterium sp. DNPG3]